MSAGVVLDLAPLTRLFARRRAILAGLAVGSLGLGLGWMGIVARFNALRDRADDADLGPLILTALLVVAPGALGMLVSECAHEVLRLPSLHLLPGVGRRLRRATMGVGTLAALVVGVAVLFVRPGLGLAGGAGLGLLGFALGLWVLARVGNVWFWVLRFGGLIALGWLAFPLVMSLEARPWLVLPLLVVAVAIAWARFAPTIVRGTLGARASGVFLFLGGRGLADGELPAEADPSRPLPTPMPPARLGGDLAGWWGARHYECVARRGRPGVADGASLLKMLGSIVALLGVVLPLLRGGWRESSLGAGLAHAADTLVDHPAIDAVRDGWSGGTLWVGLGIATSALVIGGARPLHGRLLYPLDRLTRARLAARALLVLECQIVLAVVAFGALLAQAALLASGQPWPHQVPLFLRMALGLGVLAPWLQAASLRLHALRGGGGAAGRGLGFLTRSVLVCLGLAAWLAIWPVAEERFGMLAVLGVAALAIAVTLALTRRLLVRHYARCDLVAR